MAKGLFVIGFTVAEVLQIQSRAKELLLEGKTIMSWGDSGSSVSKQFSLPLAEVLEECAYALRKLNPTKYPPPRTVSASSVIGYLPK